MQKKQKEKKEKREIIVSLLKEIKDDLLQLQFGQIVIYVQNSWPYRKEVRKSKTIKRKDKDLTRVSESTKIIKE